MTRKKIVLMDKLRGVNDEKMDVHEFKWKEWVKWSRSGILSPKPVRTLRNMTHLFTLLLSWQQDQRVSIVQYALPTTANEQCCVLYYSCHSSQCGWSSDANCSANKGGHNLRLNRCSI